MPQGILFCFVLFLIRIVYSAPGLLVTNGFHLSQRMRGILVHMWACLEVLRLGFRGKGDKTRLIRDEYRGSILGLRFQTGDLPM